MGHEKHAAANDGREALAAILLCQLMIQSRLGGAKVWDASRSGNASSCHDNNVSAGGEMCGKRFNRCIGEYPALCRALQQVGSRMDPARAWRCTISRLGSVLLWHGCSVNIEGEEDRQSNAPSFVVGFSEIGQLHVPPLHSMALRFHLD